MMLDQHGFAHAVDTSAPMPILKIGIANTATQLVKENPYLRDVVPKTIDSGDQLRLALQSPTEVRYSDGDIQLNFCAKSINADGNYTTSDRVAFIGGQLCDAPANSYENAFQQARDLMQRLESGNPGVQDLRRFYLTASREQLIGIGGDMWSDVEEKRGMADSYEKLLPVEEEERRFKEAVDNPRLDAEGRPVNMRAMLGVYAGKWVVIELGVSSQAYYGGQNLSPEQRMARRYSVALNLRLRSDIDPASVGR